MRTGYGEWVDTYEQTVEDVMDLALLERLEQPHWSAVRHALDLGCGTGRTGEWLRRQGVELIDGVDLTPEMLAVAQAKGAHRRLVEANVIETGLAASSYDLVIASLIDEHLADVAPLYAESFRLAERGALFVIVAFHPHFIMTAGMPTHFTTAFGESVAISTHVHLLSEQITAGLAAGWALAEMREGVIDERWLEVKPKWERFYGHPISAALVWRKP